MRYADGPTAEVSVLVEAPADVVWRVVTDISVPARFSEEFLGAEWIDEADAYGGRIGARFRGRNRHPAIGEWETVSYVSRWEPGRVFGWDVSDPRNPSSSWWFELSEQPGGVLLTFHGRLGPAPSGLSAAIAAMPDKEERIIARRLAEFERNMTATLAGVKELAEASR